MTSPRPITRTADNIRALVQGRLAPIDLDSLRPRQATALAMASYYTQLGEAMYEIAPWEELADRIGDGFITDTDPIDGELAEYVLATTSAYVADVQRLVDRGDPSDPAHRGRVLFLQIMVGEGC